jgi:hypothetical protein
VGRGITIKLKLYISIPLSYIPIQIRMYQRGMEDWGSASPIVCGLEDKSHNTY